MDNSALHVMRIPAKDLLAEHRVQYKPSQKGTATWFNFAECPVCKHKGYQCGLSESFDSQGRSVKGFKCQHTDADVQDFYRSLGYSESDLNTPRLVSGGKFTPVQPAQGKQKKNETVDDLPKASNEAIAVLQKRLREDPAAMQWLHSRGLLDETIRYFKLGLSKPYEHKKTGVTMDKSLVYPVFNRAGVATKRFNNYNIPGLTQNPVDQNGWGAGTTLSNYGGNPRGRSIFVCEGAKDLWILHQHIQNTPLAEELLLVTSTHGSNYPWEWQGPEHWKDFDVVFFGQDNDEQGEKIVEKLVSFIGRDAGRVRVPKERGKDWTDFFKNGGTIEEFQALLNDAPPATITMAFTDESKDDGKKPGLIAYKPVDINGSFYNGHLHYTQRAILRVTGKEKDERGNETEVVQERGKTIIARSDGAMLTARTMPAPKGTPHSERIQRLSDGTLIAREPKPSPYATWEWESIKKYLRAKAEKEQIAVRPLRDMVRAVLDYLSNQVWLPHPEDYVLLALAVPVTYIQTVFEAIPLFLVNGPKGSGKTELGRAMCDLSANALMIGQSSAATVARAIDSSRGLMVLDDLESVGSKRGGETQFSELIQALKLSYKKSTSRKIWTDVKTMQVEELDFYGVKMINNTVGVDAILGSRMFAIQTRKRLPAESELWEKSRKKLTGPPVGLRQEFHVWAFECCREIYATYQRMYSQGSDRADEIAAPLRVIAEMTGDRELQSKLEAGLARQARAKNTSCDEPEDYLKEALRNVVIEGYREVAIAHLVNEIRKIVPEFYGQEHTTDIADIFRPEWVGRELRHQGWIEETEPIRKRLQGRNLRIYQIGEMFVRMVAGELLKDGKDLSGDRKEAVAFCRGCEGCEYRMVGCDLMARNAVKENKYPLRAVRH